MKQSNVWFICDQVVPTGLRLSPIYCPMLATIYDGCISNLIIFGHQVSIVWSVASLCPPLLQQHNEYYTTITITLHWLQLPSPFFPMLLYGVYKGPGWVKFGIRYPTYPLFWDKSPFYEKKNFENIWKYHNQSQHEVWSSGNIQPPDIASLADCATLLLVLLHSMTLLFVTLAVWLIGDMWHLQTPATPATHLLINREKKRENNSKLEGLGIHSRTLLSGVAIFRCYISLGSFKLDSLLGLIKLWRNTNVNIIFTTAGRETTNNLVTSKKIKISEIFQASNFASGFCCSTLVWQTTFLELSLIILRQYFQ